MITYDELHNQNHRITELSNVLLQLFRDRSMCDNGICCELFNRYMDLVREHIDIVDRNLYSKLLTNQDNDIQKLAHNFMSGSHEIRRIMTDYTKKWCPKKQTDSLAIADHERFLEASDEMFRLVLERIQNETEKLYPLIKELNNDSEKAA